MTIGILIAVLVAAFLHAGWNAIIKTGLSKQSAMFMLSAGHAVIGAAITVTRPFPAPDVWPWLVASGLIHMAYQLFLAFAYEQGDLSRVYPIARGAAPMVVLVVSILFLADPVSSFEYMGIAVLGCGIFLMARGVFSSGESRRLLPFALGSAMATAGYTLADGLGARVSGDPVGYVSWLMIMSAVIYTPAVIALRGVDVVRVPLRAWGPGFLSAAASYLAYAIVVWAMTKAPIAVVSALRETSILFAVLMGWAFFGEKMGAQKIVAALLIVAGVILTRL